MESTQNPAAPAPIQPPSSPEMSPQENLGRSTRDSMPLEQQTNFQVPSSQEPTQNPTEGQMPPQSQTDFQQQRPEESAQNSSTDEQYYNDQGLVPGFSKPMKEEILLQWTAPSRPFKKHNRQFYSTIGVIAGLIALILFFAGQVLPVAVVIAVVFLTYVMNSIEPGDVVHKLTTYGIRVEDELYYWEELGRFWIKEKFDQPVLYIEVGRFPSRLTILLGKISKEDMTLILDEVLLNEEPPPTSYEKAAKWLHEKIPIDLEA